MIVADLIPGATESIRLCKLIWPDEWAYAGELVPSRAAVWLNAKTGLTVPGTASASFEHWLPRLREIAAERGIE